MQRFSIYDALIEDDDACGNFVYYLDAKKIIEQKDAEISRLKELTENDAIEIGSYRDVTGLRGENMKLMEVLADLAEENEKLQRVVDALYDGPPSHGRTGTTMIAGREVEMEADWCDYEEVMDWWTPIDEALADLAEE